MIQNRFNKLYYMSLIIRRYINSSILLVLVIYIEKIKQIVNSLENIRIRYFYYESITIVFHYGIIL